MLSYSLVKIGNGSVQWVRGKSTTDGEHDALDWSKNIGR